jgi:hypothetical protein
MPALCATLLRQRKIPRYAILRAVNDTKACHSAFPPETIIAAPQLLVMNRTLCREIHHVAGHGGFQMHTLTCRTKPWRSFSFMAGPWIRRIKQPQQLENMAFFIPKRYGLPALLEKELHAHTGNLDQVVIVQRMRLGVELGAVQNREIAALHMRNKVTLRTLGDDRYLHTWLA